jgi:hypothetical protein
VEGEPEEALLAAVQDAVGEVEERRRRELPAGDDPDAARLLDHEQAPAAVVRGGDEHRRGEPCGHDRREGDRWRGGGGSAGR